MAQPASLLDILPTLTAIAGHEGHAATLDGRSLLPLLDGADEDASAPIFGELTCEGCIAPVFMVRQGNWKLITCRADPDQLFNLADDPHELNNLAADSAHADIFQELKSMANTRWNSAKLEGEIRESQLVRLTVWHALREGKWYPWDYQPLRDASEQYMRNHKDLNVLEKTARFPVPPQPEKKSG